MNLIEIKKINRMITRWSDDHVIDMRFKYYKMCVKNIKIYMNIFIIIIILFYKSQSKPVIPKINFHNNL